MIVPPAGVRVLVATRPVDFRKGMDGLAALAKETLGQNPFSGTGSTGPACTCRACCGRRRRSESRRIVILNVVGSHLDCRAPNHC
jgi:hypothetical protein